MANLYEIDAEIMSCVDMETGEVIDEDKLGQLTMDRNKKLENISLWIKNLKSDAEAYKAEKEAFAQRQKAAENKAESLKAYLTDYLAGESFRTEKVMVSFRETKSVNVELNALMSFDGADTYLRYKEPEPDKAAIKKALEAGQAIPGCEIVAKKSISIK